jgi:flagellar basal-body rod protein FlgG
MITSLRDVASGLMAQQSNLEVISNNIANANTTGFKKSRAEFEDLLYDQLSPQIIPGAATEPSPPLVSGEGAQVSLNHIITMQGDVQQTDNPLDVAIYGEGYFEVDRPDGTKAYTRDGSFKLDNQGRLQTADGSLVAGITIPADAEQLVISETGVVSVKRAGSDAPEDLGTIPMARFENPSGLESVGDNLFVPTAASGNTAPWDANAGKVLQHYLEGSNVSYAEEMTKMMNAQRAYQLAARSLQTVDNMIALANQLRT